MPKLFSEIPYWVAFGFFVVSMLHFNDSEVDKATYCVLASLVFLALYAIQREK